ncbi:hypothetical protein EDB85DRAFT_2150360 [Lactarius pseudohatsudake]|nr:hypothetical protein EDB85DRAFT_2150360 [Lactarius pseudohatsudake]
MLLDLPANILPEVLVLLDHCSILRCSPVCGQLHALVATSLDLQYRIELAAGGLIDGPSRGPASTAAARVELLLERRVAWRVMRPRRRAAVALAGLCHAYELAGGLFAKAIEEFRAARRLVASWQDFALDPSQDLIVFLEHRPVASASSSAPNFGAGVCVHLRKLSAGASYAPSGGEGPRAVQPCARPVHGCMIQAAEDIVGVYFWMPLHGVLIWNWMTGEELVVRLFIPPRVLLTSYPGDQFVQGDQVPERIWEFSFLSPRAYMMTTLKDGGEIHIYSFASPSALPRASTGSPFSFARTARVHVFTLHHDPGAHRGRWQPVCFVMHNRTLMRYVEAYRDDGAGAMDVPWEEWGPTETRFSVLAMRFQWLRYVHGTRVVCPVLQPSGECRVEVLDFNMRASRAPTATEKLAASRLGIDLTVPVEGSRLVCEPSVFPTAGIFAEEVVTRLPYYSVPAPGQHESYVGYVIDEQRLHVSFDLINGDGGAVRSTQPATLDLTITVSANTHPINPHDPPDISTKRDDTLADAAKSSMVPDSGEHFQSTAPEPLLPSPDPLSVETSTPAPDSQAETSTVERARIAFRRAEEAKKPIDGVNTRNGVITRIKWLMDTVSPVAELHPFAKMAYNLISAIPQTLLEQYQRDENVLALLEAMRDAFDFTNHEDTLKSIKPDSKQAKILTLMLQDICNCGDFIQSYAKELEFWKRTLKNVGGGASKEIEDLSAALAEHRRTFFDQAIISTEITAFQILDDVGIIKAKVDWISTHLEWISSQVSDDRVDAKISEIPYGTGSRFTPSKGCLPGTRTAFLDFIVKWVDGTASERSLVLFGQAGTGKSSIAHEIARRFDKMHRLTSSFIFLRKEQHKPHHLFTTLTRDLADRYPSFKRAPSFMKVSGCLNTADF